LLVRLVKGFFCSFKKKKSKKNNKIDQSDEMESTAGISSDRELGQLKTSDD
jgi:hypothetical protein